MNDKELYRQIQQQMRAMGRSVKFAKCVISLQDAAQALSIQPSHLLDLIALGYLRVHNENRMSLYATELEALNLRNSSISAFQSVSLNNVCNQFLDMFPLSEFADSVGLIQKLYVNKNHVTQVDVPTPIEDGMIFHIVKRKC